LWECFPDKYAVSAERRRLAEKEKGENEKR